MSEAEAIVFLRLKIPTQIVNMTNKKLSKGLATVCKIYRSKSRKFPPIDQIVQGDLFSILPPNHKGITRRMPTNTT
jgi:hypothetical protein